MNKKTILAVFAAALLSSASLGAVTDGVLSGALNPDGKDFKEALRLYERGMTSRASSVLETIPEGVTAISPEEYAVLADVVMNIPGYHSGMEEFLKNNPESVLAFQIRYRHALNLFDAGNYQGAMGAFAGLYKENLAKEQVDEFLFKQAYCALECGDVEKAERLFEEIDMRPVSDYTAPARYALGYICYEGKEFQEAVKWLELALSCSKMYFLSSSLMSGLFLTVDS